MLVSAPTTITASILPGGCFPPVGPTPTFPDHNCWDPRTWGVQLPAPGADVQAIEGTKQLG